MGVGWGVACRCALIPQVSNFYVRGEPPSYFNFIEKGQVKAQQTMLGFLSADPPEIAFKDPWIYTNLMSDEKFVRHNVTNPFT